MAFGILMVLKELTLAKVVVLMHEEFAEWIARHPALALVPAYLDEDALTNGDLSKQFNAMKSHISATIDRDLLEQLDRFGREEQCTRSQIIVMALERFLHERDVIDDAIVTSPGHFEGRFSQEETYERG